MKAASRSTFLILLAASIVAVLVGYTGTRDVASPKSDAAPATMFRPF